MTKKPFNKANIAKLPKDKPVVYELETSGGRPNYVGTAKKGRVHERLGDHLPGGSDPVPAKTLRVTQFGSIEAAKAAEKRLIDTRQPKYNKQHR